MANIKGIALINLVKALRNERGVVRSALAPELRSYLGQRVLVSRWYPQADFMDLASALVAILPDQGMDPWEWMGRRGARTDFSDTYSMMIRHGDPLETLQRYPRVWRLYHDAGRLEIAITGTESARVEVYGTALATRSEFCRLQGGHLSEMLDMVGAEVVKVENTRVATGADAACWSVSWTI